METIAVLFGILIVTLLCTPQKQRWYIVIGFCVCLTVYNSLGGIVAFGLAVLNGVVDWFGRNWMPWGLVIVGTLAIAVKSAIMGAKRPIGGKNGRVRGAAPITDGHAGD